MLRNWEFTIAVERASALSLHLQIGQALIDKIRCGLLRPGTPLPGSRELARQAGVNRKTIVLVYDELAAQGWLVAQGKRGTFVSPSLPLLTTEDRAAQMLRAAAPALPAPAYQVYGSAQALPAATDGAVIAFNDGVPDTRLVPFEALSRAFRLALLESARGNRLAYGDPRGLALLRQTLAAMLRLERGLNADADTICMVRGSQMGIYLAARLLVRPGDAVALEKLTYPAARAAFRACGATVLGVDQDQHGMLPASLEALCRRHRVRAVYLTPHHQFPTTVTMPAERRMRLLALAEQFDFAIVEDDYDHEFHFSHHPMLPIASVDRQGRVIYIGSLSKILAPGLRIGYVVAPPGIINRLAGEVMLIDRQGNAVTERAAAELLQSGELKRHIRRALTVYRQRCLAATALVRDRLGACATVTQPDGGLALWLRLDPAIDMARLERDSERERVSVLPGRLFADQFANATTPVHALRLGFGSFDANEMAQGVERLRRALMRQA